MYLFKYGGSDIELLVSGSDTVCMCMQITNLTPFIEIGHGRVVFEWLLMSKLYIILVRTTGKGYCSMDYYYELTLNKMIYGDKARNCCFGTL